MTYVEMKVLRIELPCESENLILFDAQPTGLENLSDREIFQESPLHVLLAPEGKSHDAPPVRGRRWSHPCDGVPSRARVC